MGSNQKYENGVVSNNGLDVKSENVNGANILTTNANTTKISVLNGDATTTAGNVSVTHPRDEKIGSPDLHSERFRSFIKRIKDDMKNKDLIPLKILFFFKYATVFVLYPFMTLHLKSLGLDETEAGLNSALIPIVSIFGPPVSGIIADRIGNFKYLLAGITLANAPFALILLLVPKARETVLLPELMTFSFGCATSGGPFQPFSLKTIDSHICSINLKILSESSSILQCGHVCSINSAENEWKELPALGQLPVSSSSEGNGIGRSYLLPDEKTFFIPFSNKRPELVCNDGICSLQFLNVSEQNSTDVNVHFSKPRFVHSSNENETNIFQNVNVTNPEFVIDGGFIFGESKFESETNCSGETETIQIRSPRLTEINCSNQCLVQLSRKDFCSNKDELKVYNVALTFGLYTVFRVLLGLVSATAFIMFEGAVLAILKEYGGDYGLQRISATLAAIIFAPLSGTLIQVFNGFTAAFCLYTVLQLICTVLTLRINLKFKAPAQKILGHLKEILSQVEILIFFAAIFVSGTAWGYLESFLFWFLQDLGGNNILMGLTISVGGLAGIPLLIVSKPLVQKFGHVNIISLGLLFYGFRLVGYSYIQNPWWCLPYEAMEALTASLAITATATYAAALSTKETIASVQGIWGSLYFGIGRASGSLFGGYFIKWYGARNTFQIFALMAFIGAILYFIVNILHIKKHTRVNLNNDEDEVKGQSNPAVEGEGESTTFEPSYIVPCDIEKFTNVPLDEDTPEGKVKFEKVRPRNNKKNRSNSDGNSGV